MSELIEKVKKHVQGVFEHDATGHDWYHIQRVHALSCHLQGIEGGNLEVVELSALLHDISDHKMNGGKLNEGGKVAFNLLIEFGAGNSIAEQVKDIVDSVSFKGANVKDNMISLEGKIVQDADRLDAIGAIGIARAFAFGGNKNRPMYDPGSEPTMHGTFESYASSKSHTINHFYEKLLLLKDRLNTESAKKIGQKRHDFMLNYLDQFYNEWNTKNL